MKKNGVYSGVNKNKISFPLGGIGSGSIGLTGNGRLQDWEIYNRPNKGSRNGFTHFAIKAEKNGEVIDTRILQGDLPPDYLGNYKEDQFQGYGFGPDRETMAGFISFKDVNFRGEFPLANITFSDEHFPGIVDMKAYNPFIPMNDEDSSIPGAFFEFEIENTTSSDMTYTLCMSLQNPLMVGAPINRYYEDEGQHFMHLTPSSIDQDDPQYGELCMATDGENVCYQEYWYRGKWFDEAGIFWKDFSSYGPLKNRHYDTSIEGITEGVGPHRKIDTASLASGVTLKPGDKKVIRYILTWYFPNYVKYWGEEEQKGKHWKNYYAKLFKNSRDAASYSLTHYDRLYEETMLFKDTLYQSSLPEEAIEAVGANISILKSPTSLRLANGEFYGWEGLMTKEGSCEGTCTHVWNYAYALPFLFPNLERSIRDLDYKYNQRESGSMSFRLQLPLGSPINDMRACADGQLGGIIKVYRDWKISGDDTWLKNIWPKVKKSLGFAWSKQNEDKWDPNRTGVLWGRQHHTLDMELFGPNSWLTGYYLGALKAASEIESYMGNDQDAKVYDDMFINGKEWVEKNLFNGEYYQQYIDIKDKDYIQSFTSSEDTVDVIEDYWSEEHQEVKYQVGEGSIIDQVVAGWHANLCGLGNVFDEEHTKMALKSLYTYNFKPNMREHYNPCRLYGLYDEAGIIMCEWPEGKYEPYIPVPYAEEVMNGFEYQAAIHMIQEGMIEEGMSIVRGVRQRYDGYKRNPWNEFECGNNYARSMASYGLLLAYSGFSYHMAYGEIGFNPIVEGDFQCFWSIDGAWGKFSIQDNQVTLEVLYGQLELNRLSMPFIKDISTITANNQSLGFRYDKGIIHMDKQVTLVKGKHLVIK